MMAGRVPPQHGHLDVPDHAPTASGWWAPSSPPRASSASGSPWSPPSSRSPSPCPGWRPRTSTSASLSATSRRAARRDRRDRARPAGRRRPRLAACQPDCRRHRRADLGDWSSRPSLVGFVPEVGRWLPGGAAGALTGTATPTAACSRCGRPHPLRRLRPRLRRRRQPLRPAAGHHVTGGPLAAHRRGGATRSRVAGARVSSSLPQPEASNLPGFSTRSALRPAASNGRARAHLLARRSPFARSGRQGGSS